MINIPQKYKDLLKKGESLEVMNPGSSEIALKKDQTKRALEALQGSKIAVLGGDVLISSGGSFSYAYDNWSVEKRAGESLENYLKRSLNESISFVEEAAKRHSEPWFVLIISKLGVI